jgi:putative ABC transport system permease protein
MDQTDPPMLKNYFTVAFRTLWKSKSFSGLNILGLSLGIACSLLILLWVQDERSVDGFHANRDRLYVLYGRGISPERVRAGYDNAGPLGEELKKTVPEIAMAAGVDMEDDFTFQGGEGDGDGEGDRGGGGSGQAGDKGGGNEAGDKGGGNEAGDKGGGNGAGEKGGGKGGSGGGQGDGGQGQAGGKTLKAKGGYAGEDLFSMFSFPLLGGNAATALGGPANIALSKTLACKLFGTADAAMGKTVRRNVQNTWKNFVVTAVFADLPENSSLQFEFMLSWKAFYEENPWMQRWDNSGPVTYVMLKPGADPGRVAAKLRRFLDKYNPAPTPGCRVDLMMQPFDEMYLNGNFKDGYFSGGRIEYVRLFTLVALFILVIACINYMNLTTARSVRRAREIGVRKVIGASKGSLIGQLLGEAVLLAALAMVVALFAVWVLLPAFNSITDKHILLPFGSGLFWLEALGLVLLIGGLAGSYPALYLSSFRPVAVLKSAVTKTGTGAVLFRKGLVVFQFTLSILLIIGTIVVTRQVKYIQTMNLGYDREALLSIPLEGNLVKQYPLFKQEALQLPGVQQVTYMSTVPAELENGTGAVEWAGKPAGLQAVFAYSAVEYGFTQTMKAQLLAGRDFSPAFPTDTTGYIVNAEAAALMGMRDPVGRELQMWDRKGKIVGVIKNLHFGSVHDPIKPLIILFVQGLDHGNILVRTSPGQTAQTLAGLKGVCRRLNPAFPFTYQFSDDVYQRLFKSEAVIGELSNYFAFLAILISCLGLLGLAIFTAEQRTKEIGIRKVLGAGAGRLFVLLSRDFLLLVLLAFVIAAPVAGWVMQRWLADYACYAPLSGSIFMVAGLLAFLIAFVTVGYHAIRTALANPVESLRAE